jgi:hypothetical protein
MLRERAPIHWAKNLDVADRIEAETFGNPCFHQLDDARHLSIKRIPHTSFAAVGDCRAIAIYEYAPLETNFDEFSACSDAEAVLGGVVGVAVIAAPRGMLLVVNMAKDRHRDQNRGYADD